ncbi:CRISPR-associated endonuclease Cas2 [Ornithinimicrobium kibberense]|uniref:CRISPR-associated endoribonuclease Cas2 n=1 Tax=Ornithinimicrobium kibberense TaxID=282060 RepID=A0ABV5V6V3_9MICO|nr:CRISPR-associated endonuclease Cas2 [Ornithinimicrobium kibberense]
MALRTVVAAYDVRDDSRRARLAALLQSVGDRTQRSVFILTLDEEQLAHVVLRANTILDLEQDSFYLFPQCAVCWDDVRCIGQAEPTSKVLYWCVL